MTRLVLLLTIALGAPACTIYFGSDDDDHPGWQPESDAGPPPHGDAGEPGGCGGPPDAGCTCNTVDAGGPWDPDAGWYPEADAGWYPEADAGWYHGDAALED